MARIALWIGNIRNRELLTTLLEDHDVVDLGRTLDPGTDLCVVDEQGLDRTEATLREWKADQQPRYAPVLLLAESDRGDPWGRYASSMGELVDAIQPIPAPKRAILGRVESLLETRDYSVELSTERQFSERVFETSPIAKTVIDTDGEIVRANARAEEVLGLSTSDIAGRSYDAPEWRIVDESGDTVPSEALPFARVMETGQPVYDYEHGIERPDGEEVWLSINMAPIRDEQGDIEYLVAAMQDRTVRRAQQRELERQLDLFEQVQGLADVEAWEYDLRTGDLYWTDQVRRIHGLSTGFEPTLEAALEYYHPEDRPAIEEAFELAGTDGVPYDLELRLIDDDGDQRWVRTRGEPQYVDGELVRIRGSIQDVTARKERELELETMTHAVDEAPVGVSLSDPSLPDNPLVYVNEGFADVTGYDPEEVLGNNCRFLQGENTDEAKVADIRRAIQEERPIAVELRNYRADGSEFWNRLEIAPVHGSEGEVVNYIGFQQDVTDRVEWTRQLSTLDRYLRHNLRNDLNVVQGLAEQVRDESQGSVTEYAAQIRDTTSDLLSEMDKEREITQALLNDPQQHPVDLMNVLEDAVGELAEAYPEATVSVSGPESATVMGTDQLALAFEELLGNALDHNDGGSATVTVDVTVDDDTVEVQVADTGPGIPEMEVDVLTGVSEETNLHHGQGLGLWLVYLIVRRSGGTISYQENEPTGSVVRLSFTPEPGP